MMALDDVSRILPLHLDFLWHGNCCGPAGGCGTSSMSGWSSRALPSHWVLDLQGKCLLQVVENNVWNLRSLERGGLGFDYCSYRLSTVSHASWWTDDTATIETRARFLQIIIVWIIGSHEIDLGTALSCVDLVEPFVQFLVAHSDSKMDV